MSFLGKNGIMSVFEIITEYVNCLWMAHRTTEFYSPFFPFKYWAESFWNYSNYNVGLHTYYFREFIFFSSTLLDLSRNIFSRKNNNNGTNKKQILYGSSLFDCEWFHFHYDLFNSCQIWFLHVISADLDDFLIKIIGIIRNFILILLNINDLECRTF